MNNYTSKFHNLNNSEFNCLIDSNNIDKTYLNSNNNSPYKLNKHKDIESKNSKYEDHLSKYLYDYYDTFNTVFYMWEIFNNLFVFSNLSFVFCLILSSFTNVKVYIYFIFAYLSIISLATTLNLYLKMKSILDYCNFNMNNFHILNNKNNEYKNFFSYSISNVISFVCLNAINLNVIVYVSLLFLKINKAINITYFTASIPMYIALFFCLFYLMFLSPALFFMKLYYNFAFYLITIACVTISLTLLNIKLDNNLLNNKNDNKITYFKWFNLCYPIIAMTINCIIYTTIKFIFENKIFKFNNILKFVMYVSSCLLILISIILFLLCKDNLITLKQFVPYMLLFIGILLMSIEKVYVNSDNNSENGKNNNDSEISFIYENTNNYTDNKLNISNGNQ